MRSTNGLLLVATAILLAVALSPAGAGEEKPPGPFDQELYRLRALTSSTYYGQYAGKHGRPGPFDEALELMTSQDGQERRKGAEYIYYEHQKLADRLIEMVESKGEVQYSGGTRRAAAGMLGLLRMDKGIIALSNSLENRAFPNTFGGMDRFEPIVPIPGALISIGRPAVPQLVENLRTSDDWHMIDKSWKILSHILGGRERTLELLEKLIAREADPAAKDQLLKVQQAAIDHDEWWTDESPLY